MIKFISDIWKIDGFPLGCLISSIKKKAKTKNKIAEIMLKVNLMPITQSLLCQISSIHKNDSD
jgi:hypothetical protein